MVVSDVGEHVVDPVSKHVDFMPSGATTLTKHVVKVLMVLKFRCIVFDVTNNRGGGCGCSIPDGGCEKRGGGRCLNMGGGCETRGGGEGLEGPDGQLSTIDIYGMRDEHLDTIPEKESDEFNKSSVEDLVPNPSEFEDECDDDESSHEEVIHEMSFKTYSNPLFDLDEEIISSEFNPIHNEDLDSTPRNDRFDTKSYLLESLLNRDESIPPGIDCDNSNSEGDTLSLERLLHDDPIPL
nr:hypothetical protein [Tanacetum cinerariifolium]